MNNVTNKIKTIRSLLKLRQLPDSVVNDLKKQLSRIEDRIADKNIYIGIIGEFSSGKSTLINSLIDADFFVTDSIQGTTTTPTLIRYGRNIDLAIKYKDGKECSYSRSKNTLLQKYLPELYQHLSAFQTSWSALKGLFSANGYDSSLIELFEHVTTSNEASAEIDYVSIYYPANILRNGIVIVDTPGTDSLNPEHTKTTQRTITDLCDMAFVLIPSGKPFSQTLSVFIDENFSQDIKDKSYFLVTKVELLRKEIERIGLIKGLKQRLMVMNDINDPNLYMAPTFLSLEQKKVIQPSGLLSHLSETEKSTMSEQFERDVKDIICDIEATKEETINKRIDTLILTLTNLFSDNLSAKRQEAKSDLETLQKLQTMPLADFMVEFFKEKELEQSYSYAESKLENSINNASVSFRRYVLNKIDSANSKDAVQGIMEQDATIEEGQRLFEQCFTSFSESIEWLQSFYEDSFKEFKQSFTETFSIKALDFEFKADLKESWRKKYKLSFNDAGITTNLIFRFFKSLSSIKEEMKSAVSPQIDEAFEKISRHYLKKIKLINESFLSQLETVKALFFKKYEKVIQQTIKEEQKKMRNLQEKISELEKSLQTISSL